MATEAAPAELTTGKPLFAPAAAATASSIPAHLSGFQVIRRNGKVTHFDPSKITIAVTKAFLAVEGGSAAASGRIHDTVKQITEQVVQALTRRQPGGGTVHIEDIQDQVELALMRSGEHKIARAYVLYREQQAQRRAAEAAQRAALEGVPEAASGECHPGGRQHPTPGPAAPARAGQRGLHRPGGSGRQTHHRRHLPQPVRRGKGEGRLPVPGDERPHPDRPGAQLLPGRRAPAARHHAPRDPGIPRAWTPTSTPRPRWASVTPNTSRPISSRPRQLELLDGRLGQYDLERITAALKPERDLQFTYLGLQTLYDRYFIHSEDGVRFELPQAFFMRVAMGLAINEIDRESRAIEFYELLSSFDFMSSTPTLFNSGTLRPQLSSCYLTTVADDLDGIYSAIKDNALLSKFAGGLGNDWTRVRGLGSHIKGTNGKSQGVVPFLKVANDTAVAVNQGGKRKGAVCAYLETWHIDIEDFLDLRKNTGDDRRRTHDMNTANWIPDLFMQRVVEEKPWTLFSPNETPELHDLTGKAFEQAYCAYEAKAARGELSVFRTIKAVDLWRKMLGMLFETGHPWVTFKDPCNLRYTNQHMGVVHSSNLCTEITLHTNDSEIAVCNLGSVNLTAHVDENGLDHGQAGADRHHRHAHARQRDRLQLLHRAPGAQLQPAPPPGGARHHGLSGRPVQAAHALCLGAGPDVRRPLHGGGQLLRDPGLLRSGGGTGPLLQLRGLPVEPGHPADRFPEAAEGGARRLSATGREPEPGLGGPAPQGADPGHAQLQHHGDRAHRHHLQHLRGEPVHRADLSEPVRQIEPVRRVHRGQPLHGARPETSRACGTR